MPLELHDTVTATTVIGWVNLSAILSKLERYPDALEAAETAHTQVRALTEQGSFPRVHWVHGVVQMTKGRALTGMRRFDEAEPVLLEALALLEKTAAHRVPKVRGDLFTLYTNWGKTDAAEPYRKTPESSR